MRVEVHDILDAVAEATGVSTSAILSFDRIERVVAARQLAMSMARDLAGMSIHEISRAFGKKPATVVLACRAVQERRFADAEFEALHSGVEKYILARFNGTVDWGRIQIWLQNVAAVTGALICRVNRKRIAASQVGSSPSEIKSAEAEDGLDEHLVVSCFEEIARLARAGFLMSSRFADLAAGQRPAASAHRAHDVY